MRPGWTALERPPWTEGLGLGDGTLELCYDGKQGRQPCNQKAKEGGTLPSILLLTFALSMLSLCNK